MSSELKNIKWLIESIRLTLFTANLEVKDNQYFEQWLSNLPDSSEFKPRENIKIDTAIIDSRRNTLTVQAGRIDYLITPNLDLVKNGDDINIGNSDDFDKLTLDFLRWLENFSQCKRLAIGVVFKLQAKNKEDSLNILQKYLPSLTIDAECSEFLYRVNRPRFVDISETSKAIVNRISSWSEVEQSFVTQQFNANQSSPELFVSESQNWAKCELDISSDVKRENFFMPNQLILLVDTFREYIVEIIQNGDVK